MSCCQVEILPNESEIVQLRKDLFQARYDANFYKSHYQNGIAIRERMRHEHALEVLKLKQKHKYVGEVSTYSDLSEGKRMQ